MCDTSNPSERWGSAMKKTASSFGASAATGAAKASPGVAVGAGAAEFFSTSVQDLISYCTLVYILVMIFYSLPKVGDTVLYFITMWRRLRHKSPKIVITPDHEITQKIQALKIRELEAEVERLRGKLKDGA